MGRKKLTRFIQNLMSDEDIRLLISSKCCEKECVKKITFDQVKRVRGHYVSLSYEKQREYLGSLLTTYVFIGFNY